MAENEYFETLIQSRLNAVEEQIKNAMEMLVEGYAEMRFISYLRCIKQDNIKKD